MFLIFAAAFIIIAAVIICVREWDDWDGYFPAVMAGLCLGTLLSMALFVVVVLPATYWVGDRPYSQEWDLVSATDSTGVNGSFVFGSGSVSSGLDLNYYVKTDAGAMPRGTYGSSQVFIIESKETPHVVESYRQCTWIICLRDRHSWSFNLTVPPGGVVNNYALDSQ